MTENNIVNPCISVCKTDPLTGFCYGCGRSLEDKKMWKDSETSQTWKENNLLTLNQRLTGWQQEAFEKSYANKLETGISLINQKLKESKDS